MVEIGFGTLFSVKDRPGSVAVVTNVRESGEAFGVNAVFLNDKQEKELRMDCGGTAGAESIDEIIGQMTLEELEQAVKRGYEMPEAVEETIELLRKYSKLRSRTV